MDKLKRCWRGVSEKQVFYLSTTNVGELQTYSMLIKNNNNVKGKKRK